MNANLTFRMPSLLAVALLVVVRVIVVGVVTNAPARTG